VLKEASLHHLARTLHPWTAALVTKTSADVFTKFVDALFSAAKLTLQHTLQHQREAHRIHRMRSNFAKIKV